MTDDPPATLEYAQPTTRFRRPVFSVAAFLVTATPIVYTYLLIELFIPKLETVYKDFATHLPDSTQLLLDIARFSYYHYHLPAIAVPVAAGFIVPLFKRTDKPVDQSRFRRRLIVLLLINAMWMLVLIVALAVLIQPWFKLMGQLAPP
jgi:type II secretory pathway component PulF